MMLQAWFVSEILGATILLIAGLYIYYKLYVFTFWHKKGVFSIEPTFPTGNITPLLTVDFFKDLYTQHKNHRLLGIYMLYKPHLMVNDPNLIREVLAKEFTSFHDRGIFSNPEIDPLSANLFQLAGKRWRTLRVKLTPTFTSGKIKQMFPILKETGVALAKYLERKAQLKEPIDVKETFGMYSLDNIMSVAFGITCDSFTNPDNEFRYWGNKALEPLPIRNSLLLWAPQVFNILSIPYTNRGVTKFFSNVFNETVEYRKSNNITRKDFLNQLMQLMQNGYVDPDDDATDVHESKMADNKLPSLEACAQAYVFYLAGFETSSTTVTFCLYELAQHQDIQDKLQNEIRTVIEQHGELTYNAMNDMTYLHKVISETMRKYPVLAVLTRTCTKEIKLDTTDVTVPLGTPIVIPVFGLHRDPSIYPDPDKFDPERFSEENIKARHPYVYLPFGEGPRICIGLRFGLIQVKIAIINTLLNHRVKPVPDKPTRMKFESGSFVISVEGGIHLLVEPIQ
ncbi:putative cytochrome P450 6a20 [Dufourea novaeangliae]|uniref:Putative cytochrome P450 6a20 n=1 Tax=Dufourea novaeangliae TaxID=178035 RepID=A0A154PDH9_DUFNO|nr:putative cytochrome P450 6a20 [Dufourea novaeangliae]